MPGIAATNPTTAKAASATNQRPVIVRVGDDEAFNVVNATAVGPAYNCRCHHYQ
jgi:hypothetical protein